MQQLICRGAQGEIPGISPLLAPLLIARGADTYEKAQAFLHPSEGDLNDPFLMPDMRAACDMVRAAIARRGIYCEHTSAANYAAYLHYCELYGPTPDTLITMCGAGIKSDH